MEENVNQRIQKLVDDHANGSVKEFGRKVGVTDTALYSILDKSKEKRVNPRHGTLYKIMQTFPDLSSDWLLTGRGEMYIDSNNKQTSDEFSQQLIQRLEKQIEELQNYNAFLQNLIEKQGLGKALAADLRRADPRKPMERVSTSAA